MARIAKSVLDGKTEIALPTVGDRGEHIDASRIGRAYIFEDHGIKMIYCVADGVAHYIFHTPELEAWFGESSIALRA